MTTQSPTAGGARVILDAAFALFMRDGYEAVSIAQIAEHAQVSKANIFHHFRSKEALYIDVIREASQGHAEFAESLLAEELSSAEKLRRLAVWEFEDHFRNEGRTRLLILEIFGCGSDQAHQLARQVFRRNFDAVVGLFVQGQRRGEFRRDFDPAVAACMLGATSSMYAQTRDALRQFPQFPFTDDPHGYANATCDLLLTSITVRPPNAGKPVPRRRSVAATKTTRSRKK